VVRLRWGNSGVCESAADRLGRGLRPLWGVFSNTDVYFIMLGGWPETEFLCLCAGGQKLGFWQILCYTRRDGKKPGFFDFKPLMSADER